MDNSSQEWINRAKSALLISKKSEIQGIYLEDLCFQAQQAAEKALKAVLISVNIEPPHSHNFNIILVELKKKLNLPNWIEDVLDLNDYAVQTRYPGEYTPVDKNEYKDAIKIATKIVNWSDNLIHNLS